MRLIRRILLAFLLLFICVLGSLHTKIIIIGGIILLLRKESFFRNQFKVKKRWVLLSTLFLYLICYPNRSFQKEDQFQSIYLDKDFETISMPWIPYLGSIISEEDGQSMAVFVLKYFPEDAIKFIMQKGFHLPYGSAFKDMVIYSKKTPLWDNFLFHNKAPSSKLPSNLYLQFLHDRGLYKDISHYFMYVPEGKNLEECEVTLFCHGFLGNWLLYPKVFQQYSDHIVIFAETDGLSGIFSNAAMKKINTKILPHAFRRLGIKPKKAHLVGLSNGCSAINTALKVLPNQFKTYTILSGGLHTNPFPYQNTNIIYGTLDRSGGVSSFIPKSRYKRYVIKGENHVLLISNPDTVFSLLENKIQH